MRYHRIQITILIASMILLLSFCKKDPFPQTATSPTAYVFKVPDRFPAPSLPADNALTVEGIKLGRMLFYDPVLSSNGRSCGGCHHQDKAFMVPNSFYGLDPAVYLNIPSLTNTAWKGPFGWFGQDPRLDLVPINDFGPHFFNTNKDTMIRRLRTHAQYPQLFRAAYMEDVLTPDKVELAVSYAIAQFLRTIVSADSKYDRYLAGKAYLSMSEWRGMQLFYSEKGDCYHCHGSMLFTDNNLHNIGLDAVPGGLGRGRYLISGRDEDMGKMKSPALRNIALTAPYMHDGRFSTLEQVIEHYNSGVKASAYLDPLMSKAQQKTTLELSEQDKADLKAFLMTLTDSTLLKNPDYSNPHK